MSKLPLTSLPDHRKGLLITGVAGLLYTFDVPLLRLAHMDYLTLVFLRGLFLFTALAACWYVWRRINGASDAFVSGKAGWAVVVLIGLAGVMFVGAVRLTTAVNLVCFLALNPIFCAVFSRVFLGEKQAGMTWVAMLVGLSGAAMIGWDGLHSGTYVGDALALGVAVCTSAVLTIVRSTGKYVITSLALGSLIAALAVAPFTNVYAVSPASLGWLGLNALLVIPAASMLMLVGPRYLPAAEVAMFFLMETILTPIWVWLIFAEVPTPLSLLGGVVIVAAIFFLSLWRYRQPSGAAIAARRQQVAEAP